FITSDKLKMKKLKIIFVFFPLLICIGNALNAQSKFVLNGKIQDKRSQIEKVYLDIQFPDRLIRDSVAVVNGKYVFKGKVEEPILAYLRASYRNKPAPEVVPVFLEPGVLTIIHQGMFSNLVVNGSQSHINFLPIFNTQSIIRKV